MQPKTPQVDQTEALYKHEWSAIRSDKDLGKRVGRRKAQKILRNVTGNPEAEVKIDRRLGKFGIVGGGMAQTKPEEWYGKPGDVFFNPRGRFFPSRRIEMGQVLHEASHIVSPEEGHGPGFAKTYLDTTEGTLGKEAATTLKDHFDAGNVRY